MSRTGWERFSSAMLGSFVPGERRGTSIDTDETNLRKRFYCILSLSSKVENSVLSGPGRLVSEPPRQCRWTLGTCTHLLNDVAESHDRMS